MRRISCSCKGNLWSSRARPKPLVSSWPQSPERQSMNTPGVILINPKYSHNVAATIRACSCFGLSSLIWTGSRVDPTQYSRLPREERMKGYKDVTWIHSNKPFDYFLGNDHPVCVEIHEGSVPLQNFIHPQNAVYVFGPEDGGVPQVIRRLCFSFVHIPSFH